MLNIFYDCAALFGRRRRILTLKVASANLVFIMLNSKAFKLLSTSRLVSRERHWTGDL